MNFLANYWPRLTECTLSLALIVSPLTVDGSLSIDVLSGGVLLGLAILSMVKKYSRLYLYELLVALFLLISGYIQSFPEPLPTTQHRMIISLLIVMFAIIPHPATKPPQEWSNAIET